MSSYTPTFPRRAATEVFWSRPAPLEHALQLYDDQTLLMDALEGFAASGLRAREAVIIVATQPHRAALERRLCQRGFDVDQARAENLYIDLDARATLAQFMVDGWPDEDRFKTLLGPLLAHARGAGRPVRAFGEMVALLCADDNLVAALHLEKVWNQVCAEESLWLFCAYPSQCLAGAAPEQLAEICAEHTRTFPP